MDVLGEQDGEESSFDKGKQKRTGSKREGVEWLKRGQKKIKDSESVLIIGGGALGIRES